MISMGNIREQFFSALLSDALDSLGYMNQALSPRMRPLDEELTMVGRARTARFVDVAELPPSDSNPYELEIALVDDLGPGDVAVFSCGTSGRIAPWGALLSTAAEVRGAVGAVMDGLVRDIRDIRKMKFPVFHVGICPLDSKGRGRIVEVDTTIKCDGVAVSPGDLIFGDADGCVVIPKAIEAEVIRVANERLAGENRTLEALRSGRRLADVFAEFQVL